MDVIRPHSLDWTAFRASGCATTSNPANEIPEATAMDSRIRGDDD
jgi:hypothetical protein